MLDGGELEDVAVEFEVGSTSPKRCTSARMQVRSHADSPNQRGLFFQVDAPDNPNQASLLDQGADNVDDLVAELHRAGRHKLAAEVEKAALVIDGQLDAVRAEAARSAADQADEAAEARRADEQVAKALEASRRRQAEAAADDDTPPPTTPRPGYEEGPRKAPPEVMDAMGRAMRDNPLATDDADDDGPAVI